MIQFTLFAIYAVNAYIKKIRMKYFSTRVYSIVAVVILEGQSSVILLCTSRIVQGIIK
jgi:hypothetical protein